MALIYCPECGKEISDSVNKCPSCGFNVKKALKSTPENVEKAKRIKKKIFFIVFPILLVAIIAFVVLFFLIIKPNLDEKKALENSYKEAIQLMEDSSYSNAIEALEAISGYKDSSQKIEECHYLYGKKLYDEGEYAEALTQFNAVENYENSASYISDCENAITYQDRIDKLADAYAEVSSNSRISLSSDGLSLTVDSKNEYDYTSLLDLIDVITTLGLPSGLYDSMCSTNALMGRLEEEYDEYTVSWSYHPDNGLDVIIKVNKPN